MGRETHNFNARHRAVLTVFLSMLFIYLIFHLFVSERSIPALLSLSLQENRLQNQYAELVTNYDNLSDKVVRLRPETLDPDLVEEYSIYMLGHGTSQGLILLNEKS